MTKTAHVAAMFQALAHHDRQAGGRAGGRREEDGAVDEDPSEGDEA